MIYYARFEPGDNPDVITITFPDVPEAITQGNNDADARAMAQDALGLALLTYPERGLPLPEPRASGKDLVPIAVAPDIAAQIVAK
jgi:antitoxin HicB